METQVKVGTHQINTIKRSVQVGWFWILIILQAYRVTLYLPKMAYYTI